MLSTALLLHRKGRTDMVDSTTWFYDYQENWVISVSPPIY